MNYITEIKAFYDLLLSKPLSTGQIALWHALMHINNKCAWAKWFTVPNQTLELLTGLSRNSILNARNVLKQVGLIDFKTNGVKATSYMLYFVQDTAQHTVQDTAQSIVQDTVQSTSTLNKLDKTRLDKTIKEKIPLESKRKKFQKPTVEQIQAYCDERKNDVNPNLFYDYYEARGWMVGKSPMKDWKAAVRTWERNDGHKTQEKSGVEAEELDKAYQKYLEQNKETPFAERLSMNEFYEQWVKGYAEKS